MMQQHCKNVIFADNIVVTAVYSHKFQDLQNKEIQCCNFFNVLKKISVLLLLLVIMVK